MLVEQFKLLPTHSHYINILKTYISHIDKLIFYLFLLYFLI